MRGKGFIIDDLTDRALSFLESNKDRPFFCYVPYNTPHSPFQVPDRFYNRFKDIPIPMRCRDPEQEELGKTRCVLAMCENIDWNVGRILKRLDELKLADNTIVLYFSDNGPNSCRWNGGMKGRKGSVDEGGVRSPLLIRWPGHIKAGTTVLEISGSIDLLPTLAGMAGIPIVGIKPLDGRNLMPLLSTKTGRWPERMIFSHQSGWVSVRTQQYRLDGAGNLFDMAKDPGQYHDISKEKHEVAAKLAKAVAQWRDEVLPESPKDDRPFTVGYPEFPATTLPARDGVPRGEVKRSASAPNCSYFTNWMAPADKITWDVEVATTGRHEARHLLHLSQTGCRLDGRIELQRQHGSTNGD